MLQFLTKLFLFLSFFLFIYLLLLNILLYILYIYIYCLQVFLISGLKWTIRKSLFVDFHF